MLQNFVRTLAACLTTISIASCATAPEPAATRPPRPLTACVWLQPLKPDAGFETRWTRNERVQAVTLNREIAKHCSM
jgi:hypothetical protein